MLVAVGCDRESTRNAAAPGTPPPAVDSSANAVVADSLVRVATPAPGDTVTSPLAVHGEARGTWFFEASFPVRLLDAEGHELAVTYARAGTLALVKDNPSHQRGLDDERRIPIVFGGR